jgi:hypothetical protein
LLTEVSTLISDDDGDSNDNLISKKFGLEAKADKTAGPPHSSRLKLRIKL